MPFPGLDYDEFDETYVTGDEVPGYAGYGVLTPHSSFGAVEPYIYHIKIHINAKQKNRKPVVGSASGYGAKISPKKFSKMNYVGGNTVASVKKNIKGRKTYPISRQEIEDFYNNLSKQMTRNPTVEYHIVKVTNWQQVSPKPAPPPARPAKPVARPTPKKAEPSEGCGGALFIIAFAVISLLSYILIL